MTKWLNAIIEETNGIDLGKFKPMDEVGPGEHIIEEVDDECKKLYALAQGYRRRAAEKRGEASTTPFIESSSRRHHLEEARKMEQKASAVMEIFQISVRHAYDLWHEEIGVRKGWKIVRIAIEDVPNNVRFFASAPFKAML